MAVIVLFNINIPPRLKLPYFIYYTTKHKINLVFNETYLEKIKSCDLFLSLSFYFSLILIFNYFFILYFLLNYVIIFISCACSSMDRVTGSDPVDGSSILPVRAIYKEFNRMKKYVFWGLSLALIGLTIFLIIKNKVYIDILYCAICIISLVLIIYPDKFAYFCLKVQNLFRNSSEPEPTDYYIHFIKVVGYFMLVAFFFFLVY